MRLNPGSALWLLRHELRMFAYNNAGKVGKDGRRSLRSASVAIWLVFFCVIQLAAVWLVRKVGDRIDGLPPEAAIAATLLLFAFATLMMSMGLRSSVEALFERNDLDLLMSSPLPTRSIFTVRLGAVVIAIAAVYLFFLAPFAHAGLLLGHFRWLGIYPTIISMALLAGSLSMLLTLALVRMIGIRRTRVTAQILGALSGAFIFLCTQAYNSGFTPARERLMETVAPLLAPGGTLAVDSLAWAPGRALLGSLWPSLAMLALGLAAVAFTIAATHRFFALGVQQAAGAGRAARRPAGATRFAFRHGVFINIALKEWRSVLRDPQLISQILLQLLYLLPLFAVVFVKNDRPLAAIAFGLCFFMSSLTGSLGWLCVAAEDAPDLLKAAPVDMRRIRQAKFVAMVLPPLALAAPVLGWAIAGAPAQGAMTAIAVTGAIVTAGLIVFWTGKPGNRADFARRAKGNLLGVLLESFSSFAWAGGIFATLTPYSARYDQEMFHLALGLCAATVAVSLGLAWIIARTRAA
jgi:ABC-2 type transport system permease protein